MKHSNDTDGFSRDSFVNEKSRCSVPPSFSPASLFSSDTADVGAADATLSPSVFALGLIFFTTRTAPPSVRVAGDLDLRTAPLLGSHRYPPGLGLRRLEPTVAVPTDPDCFSAPRFLFSGEEAVFLAVSGDLGRRWRSLPTSFGAGPPTDRR